MNNNNHIYLLYNLSYGGFNMNRDFLIELFKIYQAHTEIGKTIFKCDKYYDENFIKKKLDKLDIEYFMNYAITGNYIINIKDKLVYYISEECANLRSNQYVIDYIFERTVLKIINNNEFTPYFYHALFQLDKDKFSSVISNQENHELIELEHISQQDIYTYKLEKKLKRNRRHRIIEDNNGNVTTDLSHITFYKNGYKIDNIYYKFNFDIDINKNNIYDILSNINNGAFLDYICFDDINGYSASLSIAKIKLGYKWEIDEYDGSESIKLSLPYEDIIDDLLNKLWNTENYDTKTKLSDKLIDKLKTLKDLSKEMYDD